MREREEELEEQRRLHVQQSHFNLHLHATAHQVMKTECLSGSSVPDLRRLRREKTFDEARDAVKSQIERIFSRGDDNNSNNMSKEETVDKSKSVVSGSVRRLVVPGVNHATSRRFRQHGISHLRPDEVPVLSPLPVQAGMTLQALLQKKRRSLEATIEEEEEQHSSSSSQTSFRIHRGRTPSSSSSDSFDRSMRRRAWKSLDNLSNVKPRNRRRKRKTQQRHQSKEEQLMNHISEEEEEDLTTDLTRASENTKDSLLNNDDFLLHKSLEDNNGGEGRVRPLFEKNTKVINNAHSVLRRSRKGDNNHEVKSNNNENNNDKRNNFSSSSSSASTKRVEDLKSRLPMALQHSRRFVSVQYLGGLSLSSSSCTDLSAVQLPLRELYVRFLSESPLLAPNCSLEVTETGLKVSYVREETSLVHELFNAFNTIAVWAALKLCLRQNLAAFLPILARDKAEFDHLFAPMSRSDRVQLLKQRHHAIFVCVMRDSRRDRHGNNNNRLVCHGFVCSDDQQALDLAQQLFRAVAGKDEDNDRFGNKVDDKFGDDIYDKSLFYEEDMDSGNLRRCVSLDHNLAPMKRDNRSSLNDNRTHNSSIMALNTMDRNINNIGRDFAPMGRDLSAMSRNTNTMRRNTNNTLARNTNTLGKNSSTLELNKLGKGGDLYTRVVMPKSKSFMDLSGPCSLHELMPNEKALQHILRQAIDEEKKTVSLEQLSAQHRQLLLRLSDGLSGEELLARTKSVLQERLNARNNQPSFFVKFMRKFGFMKSKKIDKNDITSPISIDHHQGFHQAANAMDDVEPMQQSSSSASRSRSSSSSGKESKWSSSSSPGTQGMPMSSEYYSSCSCCSSTTVYNNEDDDDCGNYFCSECGFFANNANPNSSDACYSTIDDTGLGDSTLLSRASSPQTAWNRANLRMNSNDSANNFVHNVSKPMLEPNASRLGKKFSSIDNLAESEPRWVSSDSLGQTSASDMSVDSVINLGSDSNEEQRRKRGHRINAFSETNLHNSLGYFP